MGAQQSLINTHPLHYLRFQTHQTQNQLRIGSVKGKNGILIDKAMNFSFSPKNKPHRQIKTQGLLVPGKAQWAAASPTKMAQWIQRYKGSLANERLASGAKLRPFDIIFDQATSKRLLGKIYGHMDKDGFCVEHTPYGIFVTGRSLTKFELDWQDPDNLFNHKITDQGLVLPLLVNRPELEAVFSNHKLDIIVQRLIKEPYKIWEEALKPGEADQAKILVQNIYSTLKRVKKGPEKGRVICPLCHLQHFIGQLTNNLRIGACCFKRTLMILNSGSPVAILYIDQTEAMMSEFMEPLPMMIEEMIAI